MAKNQKYTQEMQNVSSPIHQAEESGPSTFRRFDSRAHSIKVEEILIRKPQINQVLSPDFLVSNFGRKMTL